MNASCLSHYLTSVESIQVSYLNHRTQLIYLLYNGQFSQLQCQIQNIQLQFHRIQYFSITQMDLAIDQPLIRSFSCVLRFFHLSLQILIACFIWRIGSDQCSTFLSSVSQPISVILLLFNLTSLGFLRCSKFYSKKLFIINLGINAIFCIVLMVVGLLAMGEANSCANNRVLNRYVSLQSLITVILVIQTLHTKYDFALRYTNAPGNLVWVFLFFSFDWSQHFKTFYIPIGIINLIITISNLSINLVFMFSSFNQNIKRIIYFVWFASLIAMVITQIIGFLGYLGGANQDNAVDVVAKKLAQTFIIINVLDGVFFIFQMISLGIPIGDSIHQQAFGLRQRQERKQFW